MNFPTTKTILFTISFASLLCNAISSPRDIHNAIKEHFRSDLLEFCKKTTNPDLCAKTIQPHFLKNAALDPFKALEVEVEATLEQAKKTIGVIAELLAKQDISKSLKDSLDTCRDQYNNMLDSIKETTDALANRDVITAKFKFSAVLSFQGACKDAFEGLEKEFPLTDDSDAVYQLGGNCLDIIADIEKAEPQKPAPEVKATPSLYGNIIGTLTS